MTQAELPELIGERGDDLSHVVLAALEQTRAAACITTADLDPPGPTIVYVNPAYCTMTGRSRSEVIGDSPRIMQGPLTERAELDRLRADLDAGRPFEGETVNYRADGTPFIINWRIDHVRDAAGTTTHFVATQQDVTRERRGERLLEAEQRLDEALTYALSTGMGVDDARRFLVETIAGAAAMVARFGLTEVEVGIEGVPYRSVDRADASGNAPPLMTRFDRPESGVQGTIGLHGLTLEERAFVDVAGVRRLAGRAATVTGALVEYQRQRRTALRLQQDLLPGPLPRLADVAVATTYLPGSLGVEVGGDWFDLCAVGNRVILSVGDVSGDGVDAAALMGRLRLLAGTELGRGASVDAMLLLLDGVCRSEERFATMLVVELIPDRNEARVWSAGHPSPLRTSESGSRLVEVAPRPPLGHLGATSPEPATVDLPIGTGMLLFTDGLIERRHESLDTGFDRLLRLVDRTVDPDEIMVRIAGAAADSSDDVAALVVLRTG